jgi:peptidoglycan-N-acetylmuramic acid deacetylase
MRRAANVCAALGTALALALTATAARPAACDKPVYLTFDTGHMAVAPLIAEVLNRHDVKVTFFLANERTKTGGGSLDDEWAPWWRARAAEGHAFASHTWDHGIWRTDRAGGAFDVRFTAGARTGQVATLDPTQYCEQLRMPVRRLAEMTGQAALPLFRAPGGKTSPALLAAARACGFTHVPWSDAGFLGDELPSDRFPNDRLLAKALRDIRAGDILLAHLGIWSRKDPWAPAVLEPLVTGLKARGLCFATLRDHPVYGQVIGQSKGKAEPTK